MKNTILKTKLALTALAIVFAFGCSKDDPEGPEVLLSSAKQITLFQFLSTDNPGLTNHITTTIDHPSNSITANVPGELDITALLPTIQVSPKATVSPSGAQNFSNPVSYTVTAEDGSTSSYMVSLTPELANAKQILSFKLLADENDHLFEDVEGDIDEDAYTVNATVPLGTDLTSLQASVEVSSKASVGPLGAQDFTNPVTYTVTAEDGTTQEYQVSVTRDNGGSDIVGVLAFDFLKEFNDDLTYDVIGEMSQDGTAVLLTVGTGTDVTALVATVELLRTDGSISIDNIDALDYTDPVIFQVPLADGSLIDFTATVIID